MPSPYRETANTPPAPLEELAWRRRVARGAGWVEILLASNFAVLVLAGLIALSTLDVVLLAVVWSATALGIAFGIWAVTAPRPGYRSDRLGWLLRASVLACLGVAVLVELGLGLGFVSFICSALVVVASTAYFAGLLELAGATGHARWARVTIAPLVVLAGVLHLAAWWLRWFPTFAVPYLCLVYAIDPRSHVRRAMGVDYHHWWFDSEMEPPGEWVSLLVHRDKHAEVLCADETLGWFVSKAEATEWLEDNGYVPAERAIEERLVSEVPPDVLRPRARKKLRSASMSPQPRVRVASEPSDDTADEAADGASDEINENAPLDEPEPHQRAVAVDDPHDPRT